MTDHECIDVDPIIPTGICSICSEPEETHNEPPVEE